MEALYIKDFESYNKKIIEEKEISIYPITLFSNDNTYLFNLIWYITDLHFFEFYRVNDYELLSISKIVSGIMENYKYNAFIDNEMIKECVEFVNEILYLNKNNILNKLFFSDLNNFNLEELRISYKNYNTIDIQSVYNDDDIIDILFTYNDRSFITKVFFSRKIDIFFEVIQSIIKLLLIGNLYKNIYIPFFHDKYDNMAIRDFVFKSNEIKIKEKLDDFDKDNRRFVFDMFFKHYNYNLFIENFNDDNDTHNIFADNINNSKKILLTYDKLDNIDLLLKDKRFKDIIKVY